MFELKVNDSVYKIKFGYKALAKSGIMKDVGEVQKSINDSNGTDEIFEKIGDVFEVLSKLVLAGLQKYHKDEFGVDYDSKTDVESKLDEIYDLLDDYMDEDEGIATMDLFSELVDELMNNGFLSKKSANLEESLTEMDATVVPMDHKKKSKN